MRSWGGPRGDRDSDRLVFRAVENADACRSWQDRQGEGSGLEIRVDGRSQADEATGLPVGVYLYLARANRGRAEQRGAVEHDRRRAIEMNSPVGIILANRRDPVRDRAGVVDPVFVKDKLDFIERKRDVRLDNDFHGLGNIGIGDIERFGGVYEPDLSFESAEVERPQAFGAIDPDGFDTGHDAFTQIGPHEKAGQSVRQRGLLREALQLPVSRPGPLIHVAVDRIVRVGPGHIPILDGPVGRG